MFSADCFFIVYISGVYVVCVYIVCCVCVYVCAYVFLYCFFIGDMSVGMYMCLFLLCVGLWCPIMCVSFKGVVLRVCGSESFNIIVCAHVGVSFK